MEDFPTTGFAVGSDERVIELRLSYVYDTHDPADGVTVHIPRRALTHLGTEQPNQKPTHGHKEKENP